MLSRAQLRVLFLGLAVFAGLGGAQVLSGSDHEFRHEGSADNENTFLDFAFLSAASRSTTIQSSAFIEFLF